MARSLQELINFLLNEIALSGNQGATLSEVLNAIQSFYNTAPEDASQRQQTIDRRFQAKVWSWLTRNPEVSVGKDSEWNHLSLDDAEYLDRQNSASNQRDPASTSASQLRVFVSNERTWYAVTGHEPDETKVPYSEFVLLSIIASHRSAGIPQTELIRLSGQDKRSVPKRTDALKRKGYIEKRAVQVKSARTSLCTLLRFLNEPNNITDGQKLESDAQKRDLIDFDAFTSALFDILTKYRIISRNDLKQHLGFDDRWRWKILSRALRKFERIGVLKRVRAESQYERLHPCVMLLREPTARDLELFHEYSREGISGNTDDKGDMDDDMELDAEDTNKEPQRAQYENGSAVEKKEIIVDAGRTVPSWTPDRNLNNQIFDVIDQAGTTGITNHDINRICFGSFYKRPSESLIHRLVDCWQFSQPPHLRHLAIVRDSAIEKTIIYYVHYSARNFAKRVDAGEAVWEAVEFSAKKAKSSQVKIPPVDATARRDEYGLHQAMPKGLVKNGNITLFEGISICKPADYSLTNSDPKSFRTPDGGIVLRQGHMKESAATPIQVKYQSLRTGRPKKSTEPLVLLKTEQSFSGPADDLATPIVEESTMDEVNRHPKLPASSNKKRKQDRFKGMSQKEKFEAMGMDETWTEYSALIMDKPKPGIYVTSHGRRRPAGKKQGRPRQSRIAIFKSPKLASFPWFVKETTDSDTEDIPEEVLQRAQEIEEPSPSRTTEDTDLKERHPVRGKRSQPSPDTAELADLTCEMESPSTARPWKVRRLRKQKDDVEQMASNLPDQANGHDEAGTEPQPRRNSLSSTYVQTRTPKRRRLEDREESNAQSVSTPQRPTVQMTHPMVTPQNAAIISTSPARQTTPHSTDRVPKGTQSNYPASAERGGSVNILRRKIVMDIVEKAGGAYPAGNEIWYPFVTAWMKMKYKEKPDMRTVRTAKNALVDAGKLRQLIFSGKDSKGVMVTKKLLIKPEMSVNDPLVKAMQTKMLASDRLEPTISFSPNVEISQEITRHSGRTGLHRGALPVVSGATVQLQSKPVFVKLEEQRKERRIQKELLKRLAEEDSGLRGGGVQRLLRLPRPHAQDHLPEDNQTRISRPIKGKRGRPPNQGTSKGLVKTIPSIGPMAILMRPGQVFHTSTGTFGTIATRVGREVTTRNKGKQIAVSSVNAADSIEKLAQLARQNRGPPVTPGAAAAQTQDEDDFHSRADRILEWELGHEEIFDAILEQRPYIEQTVNSHFPAPIEGDIRFDTEQEPVVPSPVIPRTLRTRRRRPRGPITMVTQLTGRRSPVPDAQQHVTALERDEQQTDERPQSFQRRRRDLRPIPEVLFRKIMVAIVAVRTLAGGLEGKMVDWDLLCLAFPQHEPNFIKERGLRIQAKNRLEMLRMQRDFQERYIEAYVKDQVPQINYDDLEGYDWPAVVEWANVELDFSTSEKVPTLPATRQQFDSMFELREEPVGTAEELFQTGGGITIAHRRSLMPRVPFAVELPRRIDPPRKKELEELETAKSWVRANVLTPEDRYNPEQAKETLARFGEALLNNATQSLITERVITMGNRGRVQPGRNYNAHEVFSAQLDRRRAIDAEQLRQAAIFKTTILDPIMQKGNAYMINYLASDGDSLALTELNARGYIELKPRNAPQDKFGLMDGGYLTRQMDKNRLRFEIEVRPCSSYVCGNPLEERSRVTEPPLPPASGKMPVWFDIHGCLMPEYWQKAIATVMGCLVMRPGLTMESIGNTVKPTMGIWELELLLEWLVKVEAVRRTGIGWALQEWWWMVLG